MKIKQKFVVPVEEKKIANEVGKRAERKKERKNAMSLIFSSDFRGYITWSINAGMCPMSFKSVIKSREFK